MEFTGIIPFIGGNTTTSANATLMLDKEIADDVTVSIASQSVTYCRGNGSVMSSVSISSVSIATGRRALMIVLSGTGFPQLHAGGAYVVLSVNFN